MKRLVILLLACLGLAGAGYGGYWLWAARQIEGQAEALIAGRASTGWISEADAVETGGFPSSFETRLTAPRFGQTEGPIIWESDWITVAQESLDPQDFTVTFAPEQRLTLPEGSGRLTTQNAAGRLRVDSRQTLDVLELATESGALTLPDMGEAALGPGRVLVTKTEGPNSYALTLSLADLLLPPELLGQAGRDGVITNLIDSFTANATAQFTGPWDEAALAGVQPTLVSLTIEEAALNADGGSIAVAGTLVPDAEGYAEGALDLSATDIENALKRAQKNGAFQGLQGSIALSFIRAMIGEDGSVSQTLRLEDGVIRLGPIPLGRAPLLIARDGTPL
ncbi:DUF2125 domain-containing protein [Paracoccaceae bacterium GXU_MW_L88]